MNTEPVTPFQVSAIQAVLGFGASLIVDFRSVDYTKGRGILEGLDRCLWTKKGQRITISVIRDGGLIASQAREVDPDLPPSVYPEINVNLFKCVKPECQEMVDRSVRKSGACCKDHMNYECSHPDCLKRAAKEGWARATHPYGTKIAKAHINWRVEQAHD